MCRTGIFTLVAAQHVCDSSIAYHCLYKCDKKVLVYPASVIIMVVTSDFERHVL